MKTSNSSFFAALAMITVIAIAASATTIATTTTITQAAYAQSDNSKACPEGFKLNKGVCQAPQPTEERQYCESNAQESPLGNCIVGVDSPVGSSCNNLPTVPGGYCLTETGELIFPFAQCAAEREQDPDDQMKCYVTVPKVSETVTLPCTGNSTLNPTTNMCEVKPGNKK